MKTLKNSVVFLDTPAMFSLHDFIFYLSYLGGNIFRNVYYYKSEINKAKYTTQKFVKLANVILVDTYVFVIVCV